MPQDTHEQTTALLDLPNATSIWRRTPCPTCLLSSARYRFQKSGFEVFQCSNCGFTFVHPWPTDDELTAHYETSYRSASANFYPKSGSRRWRAFIRSLRFFQYTVGKNVLDIGCGGGFMAEAFTRLGAHVTGIDISRNSIDYARKHFRRAAFHCESLADFRKRGLSFDFIFSSEVLEHLPGPEEFMETLVTVLRPGGFVYLSAPDAGHPAVPTDLETWTDICPPEHLQFFNLRNLTLLFERYGFTLHKTYCRGSPAHSVIFRR